MVQICNLLPHHSATRAWVSHCFDYQALWLHKTPDLRRESLRLSILCSKQTADNTADDRAGFFSGQALVIA